MPAKIFISYSQHDQSLLDEFVKHLAPLKITDKIVTWNDKDIVPSDNWEDQIMDNLNGADVIILLVSQNFMASDFIMNTEVRIALERQQRKEAAVLPVIIRHCAWHNLAFGKLHALPYKGNPVMKFLDRDEAWFEVVTGLKKLLASINK